MNRLRRPEIVAAAATALACVVFATSVLGVFAGVAAGAGCWWVVRGLAARPVRPVASPELPVALELIAAALRAGRPVADAVAIGAELADPAARVALTAVADRLRLGVAAAVAWRPAGAMPELAMLATVAARSSVSGARLAAAFDRLAARLRAEAATAALARAQRVGVLAMLPLGLCYLPAFVCLGVVPVVVGVARSAFATLG